MTPTPTTYVNGIDFRVNTYPGSGAVSAPLEAPSGDARGCNATDFGGFTPGRIALVSRGAPPGFPVACTFRLKTNNAIALPGGTTGPPGSAAIEQLFHDYFASQGLPTDSTALNNRSDYGSFTPYGVPVGGVFSGADGIKTAAQAEIFGGTAGIQYDPCYHAACDTFENVSSTALDQNADAIAHAVITYAQTKAPIVGLTGAATLGARTAGAAGGSGEAFDA